MLILLERTSLAFGALMVVGSCATWLVGAAQSRAAIVEFEREFADGAVDQSLWSDGRKAAYERDLGKNAGATLGILRIPSVGIEVPVFDSVSATALNRGAGHVESTARPDEEGNIAIASHRDGFFRGLKDIHVGARVELATRDDRRLFVVSSLDIVDPLDVSVLDDTDATVLTLITCYPFYHIGPAPDRFIVRAALAGPEQTATQEKHDAS